MLHQLIAQLSDAEREAVGAAALVAYQENTLPDQKGRQTPVTLSTGDEIMAPTRPLHLRVSQMQEGYRDVAYTSLLNVLCSLIDPKPGRRQRDDVIEEPSHSLISISRISSSRTALFDHAGLSMHPIALRLHRARDYNEEDRLDTKMMRMEEEQLLEIMMSETQYARLIRCDQSLTPCTLARRHLTGHELERNPHFDEQFDTRDIQKEVREALSNEMSACQELHDITANGVTKKADREAAEATLLTLLAQLDTTMAALHDLADGARDQASDAAHARHRNLMGREVEALPDSMRQQLKQLADADHPTAKLLSVDKHNN